jgi:hypothetical protein
VQIAIDDFRALLTGSNDSGTDPLIQGLSECLGAPGAGDEFRRYQRQAVVVDDAHVILANADHTRRASVGNATSSADPLWLDIGCASKLITATTFQAVQGGSNASLRRRVTDILDLDVPEWYSSITLEHLLNHTHGIDEPEGMHLLVRPDGTIDSQGLLASVGKVPLAIPGSMYSYSCTGIWLLAAALEKIVGERFVDIVRQAMPGILPPRREDDALCPALGVGVRINAEQLLLQFVKATSFESDLASRTVRLGPALSFPYPGWMPQERGICLGWKVFNSGWYGHQAIWTKTPVIVRVNPSQGIGYLVSSRSVHPSRLVHGLFSQSLIGQLNQPKSPLRRASLVGTYERVDSRFEITMEKSGLTMVNRAIGRGRARVDMPEELRSLMKPVAPGIFEIVWTFSEERDERRNLLEFVLNASGEASHIWFHGMIWRRTA